jgi:hypothetical protein
MTLKVRKIFKLFVPLPSTLTVGADYNTQLGVWQFRTDWEDNIIHGRLTVRGRELQLAKTWTMQMGEADNLVTRVRFRAAIDMQTGKSYAKVGFRSENASPLNLLEGFQFVKYIPLSTGGKNANAQVEVKANFACPEPEYEFSSERAVGQKQLIGMGDMEIALDELNLLLTY